MLQRAYRTVFCPYVHGCDILPYKVGLAARLPLPDGSKLHEHWSIGALHTIASHGQRGSGDRVRKVVVPLTMHNELEMTKKKRLQTGDREQRN